MQKEPWSIMIPVRNLCGGQGPQPGIGLPQRGNGIHIFNPFNSTSGILEQNCTGNQPDDTNPFLAIPGIGHTGSIITPQIQTSAAPEGLLDLQEKGLLTVPIQM